MLRYSWTALRHPSEMSAAFTSIGLKPKQASKSLKYEAELRNGIFCDFLPQHATIFRFYNCFTQEKEKEKNENNLEGKRINYAISSFTFLVALQARISGYFH